jgi:hypothetical protein
MLAIDYITAALARSAASRPELVVTSAGELLGELNRIVEELFVDSSIANAPYFTGESTVAFDVTQAPPCWSWPAEAHRVYAVYALPTTTGSGSGFHYDELSVVPHTDMRMASEMPAVVESGRCFLPVPYPAGLYQLASPTGGDLRLRYARRATPMTTLGSPIDTGWPAGHDGLVIDLLATWLAAKDQRAGDVEAFATDAAVKYGRFMAHVGLPTATTATRTGRNKGERLVTP